ncbi:MAG TPA: hypothetical protein VGI45_05580 [Terracidiphilus sp.]
MHVFTGSLAPIDFIYKGSEGGIDCSQALLSRDSNFREIPIKLGGIPKSMPSRFVRDWWGRGEDMGAIDGGCDYDPFKLSAGDKCRERNGQDER